MTARVLTSFGLLIAATLWTGVAAHGGDPRGAAPVTVALRPTVHVGDRLIRIGDVARISGGDAAQRSRVAQLDLVEFEPDESTLDVTRTLVQARLLLGGIAPAEFRIEGAAIAQVSCLTAPGAERQALDAVRRAVAAETAVPEEDVVVLLAQPLTDDALERIMATADGQLEARLLGPAGTGGRMRVALWTGGGTSARRETPIVVDVRFR